MKENDEEVARNRGCKRTDRKSGSEREKVRKRGRRGQPNGRKWRCRKEENGG